MNSQTPLWRQVHPTWIHNGRVTSLLFTPFAKDEGKPSVYDGDKISAEDSWKHFTSPRPDGRQFQSKGVMAVTIEDCTRERISVVPDPETFDEHVLLDYTVLPEDEWKAVAKALTSVARARDWQFIPPNDSTTYNPTV